MGEVTLWNLPLGKDHPSDFPLPITPAAHPDEGIVPNADPSPRQEDPSVVLG